MSAQELIVALGANLGDRAATFDKAVDAMVQRIGPILAQSEWLETEPLNHPENPDLRQPPYLNGVVVIGTDKSTQQIFEILESIESQLGRSRDSKVKWGPRVIDLDILALGDLVLETPDLSVPHPEMAKRRFVLEPLCQVRPEWVHPILKQTARMLLRGLTSEAKK